ncbi:MAG: 4Fe-4S dicluster domain-containing protein [Planctomycetaceae bacterium]|jgi:formate dehydrogenase iron-sulfur subunit|nr:4Fe-4S dicluster domain-containing protein [Planctomycetaceae bacterium]
MKGVLVDLTKCIGCGSCSVACKLYNDNKWVEDRAETGGPRAQLCDANWTVVRQVKLDKDLNALPLSEKKVDAVSGATDSSNQVWRFVKTQCFHCAEPACVASCFAKALQKDENGATVYYPNSCVGCRYCMLACPFHTPKFEWEKPLPRITKCMFCSGRLKKGESPACVSVCPTNVMKYGDRDELLQEAKQIIAKSSGRYVEHVYGEEEVGGTAWIYISDVPFEQLGFRVMEPKNPNSYPLPRKALPHWTEPYMHWTPILGGIWGVVLAGLYIITRRNKVAAEKNASSQPAANG